MSRSDRSALLSRYPFDLDRFQLDALDALDEGSNVIVAAPTGSGKTVVAEYGIARALSSGTRAFYTAPIKALSNQKYRDLLAVHGAGTVGLLTGDVAVDGDAPAVVMTTEVLRNMIYGRRRLDDLTLVVLDEVHFLQDSYRGPVWEEVIIHLPAHVQLVCLSATVSNAQELASWMETVRGPTVAVVEERRPVRLDQWYMVSDRTDGRLRMMPTIVHGRPNDDAVRLDAGAVRGRSRDRSSRDPARRRLATPTRLEVIDELSNRDLLPAIYFIFSRNQCDEAARGCVDAGLRLIDDDQRAAVRDIAMRRLEGLSDHDLDVLGVEQFLLQLDHGVAAHHAGLVPAFKEIVEVAFQQGLVEVVFATETLAVGVNMPARTVVIEKLTKYTGDHHEPLSPAQYTQLTGRAGRRGIDTLGSAVVLWSPFVRFDQVAELASSRSFHLRSAFRPTYNMAANLVRTYDADLARRLLTLSFAQFQSDRDVVRLERRLQRQRERLAAVRTEAASPFGDIDDYRRSIAVGDDPIGSAMAGLRPGDVIQVSRGRHHGPAAVVATAHRAAGLKLTVVTPAGHSLSLEAGDFEDPPHPLGSIVLPGSFSPHRRSYRDDVARRIRAASLRPSGRRTRHDHEPHPVEADPDLRRRLRAAAEGDRLDRDIAEIERRVEQRDASLARQFESVLTVLDRRGYVDRDRWVLTDAGEMLARLFHECDLLVAESVRAGLLDGLDAPSVAGLVSTFVHEHRSPDEPPAPWFPDGDVRRRWGSIERLGRELGFVEREFGLSPQRAPDPTFFAIAYAWVAGDGFAELVADEEITGGDFVRTVKQLIDLLRQLGQVAPDERTRAAARAASEAAFRGVVADSSTVEPT